MNKSEDEKNDDGRFPNAGKPEDERPTEDWGLNKLGQYAKRQDELCRGMGRKMAVHRRREGHALTLAHQKIGYGDWGKYLTAHGIAHSSDGRARALYAEVETEEELDGMKIMDAYEKYGVEKRKPPNPKVKQTGEKAKVAPKKVVAIDQVDRSRVEKEFVTFAKAKGWDDDRKIQVLTELSFPERLQEMLDDLVAVGHTDELLGQLHQYYGDESDYLSRLLVKVVAVSEGSVTADGIGLIDKAIERLTQIRQTAVQKRVA